MINRELLLSKNSKIIAVTRDMSVYWFGKFDNEYLMYGLGTDASLKLDKYWDENLLAKRNGVWDDFSRLPRNKDVIFVYEFTNDEKFFDMIRENEFMEYEDLEDCSYCRYVKLIYERIDGVFEPRK